MSELWTLPELTDRVTALLSGTPTGRASARVRDVPDARTIRWYQTTGIVDRPVMRGRTAFYGLRHLLQLVAIKRLQAQGHSLAEIQGELAGLNTRSLERIAQLPGEFSDPTRSTRLTDPGGRTGRAARAAADGTAGDNPEATKTISPADALATADVSAAAPGSRRFWSTRAEGARAPLPSDDAPAEAGRRGPERRDQQASGTGALVPAVRLGGQALLVLDGGARMPCPEDLPVIEAAAAPLLEELHRLGLLSTPPPSGPPRPPDSGSLLATGSQNGPDSGPAAPTTKEPA